MALQARFEPDLNTEIVESADGTFGVTVRAKTIGAARVPPRPAAAIVLRWLREQRIYPIHQYTQLGKPMYLAALIDPSSREVFWFIKFRTFEEATAFFLRWS